MNKLAYYQGYMDKEAGIVSKTLKNLNPFVLNSSVSLPGYTARLMKHRSIPGTTAQLVNYQQASPSYQAWVALLNNPVFKKNKVAVLKKIRTHKKNLRLSDRTKKLRAREELPPTLSSVLDTQVIR